MNSIVIVVLFVITNAALCADDCDYDDIDEGLIHACCKHPDSHDSVVKMCAEQTGFKAVNAYKDPFLDVTSDEVIANTCFAECLFNQYGFIRADNLEMAAVRKHYNHSTDAVYASEMIDAFERCHSTVEDKLSTFMSNDIFQREGTKHCNPKPTVIWACVVREFFHNCPEERWSENQQCRRVLEFSKKCKNFN